MEQPDEVQRAMIIQGLRSISRRQGEILEEVRYMKRSLYGLLVTVLGGLILFVLQYGIK